MLVGGTVLCVQQCINLCCKVQPKVNHKINDSRDCILHQGVGIASH